MAGRRRKRRVQWSDRAEAGAEGVAPGRLFIWRCAPDDGSPRPPSFGNAGQQSAAVAAAAAAASRDDLPVLKLCSADGHIFEADAVVLFGGSSVVRGLVEDNGCDEAIPLPGVGSQSLQVFLGVCQYSALRGLGASRVVAFFVSGLETTWGADKAAFGAVMWTVKLLEMGRTLCASLAELVEDHEPGDFFDHCLYTHLLMLIEDGAYGFSPLRLAKLIAFVASGDVSDFKPRAVASFALHLGHVDGDVRRAAVDGLQSLATPDAFLLLCQHKDYRIRAQATRSFPRSDPETAAMLVKLTKDPAFPIRESAALALKTVALAGDPIAVEALVCLLGDAVREVREAAVISLRFVAVPDDEATVTLVMARVAHADWPVQCAALRALADVAPGCEACVRELAERMRGGKATVAKGLATRLLAKLDGKSLETFDAGKDGCSVGAASPIRAVRQRAPWCDEDD